MAVKIHPSWHNLLKNEFEKPYWEELITFVKKQYSTVRCFPEGKNIFRAFDLTPPEEVRVVILGQDPYHTPGAAMGLSFSVPDGSRPQPSLKNIFEELQKDLGVVRTSPDLTPWAEQGVLLLNAVLTVQSGSPASHSGKGWEIFTDEVIKKLSEQGKGIVFILWGNFAASKRQYIDESKHLVITSAHPSPFSAHKGFFGSSPFSKANMYLESKGRTPIDWGKEKNFAETEN